MFGIKLIANYVTRRRNKAQREILKAREAAVLVSTGVFLDTSVYFAFSNLLRCHNFLTIETSLSYMKTVRSFGVLLSSFDASF